MLVKTRSDSHGSKTLLIFHILHRSPDATLNTDKISRNEYLWKHLRHVYRAACQDAAPFTDTWTEKKARDIVDGMVYIINFMKDI